MTPIVAPPPSRRILTLQRQLRTLGRIRTGWSEPTGKTGAGGREIRRPVRSPTFILTSAQEDNVLAAADMWGGEVGRWKPQGPSPEVWRVITQAEVIDAILPPGDPLTQYNEFWSGGGCTRRCDGVTEMKTSKPCLCLAEHGETWYELPASKVCRPTSRLNVFLDLDDFGYWRVESHSFYGAQELAGTVDLIKGLIGYGPAVPIRLRIDQRVAVKDGKGTPYPVIVVELRGQVGAQILAGVAPKLAITTTAEGRQAIEAGQSAPHSGAQNQQTSPVSAGQPHATVPTEPSIPANAPAGDLRQRVITASTVEVLRAMWNEVAATKDRTLKAQWWARKRDIDFAGEPAAPSRAPEAAEVVVEAETEPDRTAIWTQILAAAGERGWDTPTVSQLMRETVGHDPADADGWAFAQFLDAIKAGKVEA